jgi:putative membrane protein
MKASEWSRVSPVSILYFFISNINKALNLWPVLAGVIAVPATREWLFEVGVVGFVLILLAISILNFWFFKFHHDNEKIQIRRGLLFKKNLTLYFERVQEANLEQAFYFRPFSLWALKLESAGSGKEEIILPGIHQDLANKIKQLVLDAQKKPPAKQNQSLADASQVDEPKNKIQIESPKAAIVDYQIKLTLIDLLRYGLMHNTLIYYVAILSPILGQNEKFWGRIAEWFEESPLTKEFAAYLSSHNLWVGILAVTLLVLLILLLIYAVSILLSLIKFWDYTLVVQGERFQYQAGLLNRLASGFRKHKLQTLVVKQSLIARLLNRYSIEVRQTNEANRKQGEINHGFVIPVVTETQLQDILQMLNIQTPEWKKCVPAKMFWDAFIYGGLLTLITAAILMTTEIPVWWSLGVLLLAVLLSIKNWYSIGYDINQNGFSAKHGILGIKTTYVPQIKIQKMQLSQGPIQRLHNTGSIALWSGATLEGLNFIPLEKLQTERENIIHEIARFRGRWM